MDRGSRKQLKLSSASILFRDKRMIPNGMKKAGTAENAQRMSVDKPRAIPLIVAGGACRIDQWLDRTRP